MKKTAALLLVFTMCLNVFCQGSLPDSWLNVGVGVGQSSGGFGVKTVLGYKNSGLLLGLGYFGDGLTGYKMGGQISSGPVYLEVGYGLVRKVQINNDPIIPIEGGSVLIGGMVGLGKAKRTFIDLGVGFSFGATTVIEVSQVGELNTNTICFTISIGHRFGGKSI